MKDWWKDPQVWYGVFNLISSIAIYASNFFADRTGEITVMEVFLLANGIAALVLRWLEHKPITSPVKALDKLRPKIMQNERARRYIAK